MFIDIKKCQLFYPIAYLCKKNRKMKKIAFILFALFFFNACKNDLQNKNAGNKTTVSDSEKQKQLVADIMVVHDEVMPMMNNIESIQKQLRNELPKIKDNTLKNKVLSALSGLESADKAMYDWMDNYKAEPEASIAEQYFTEEKVRVTQMAEKVKQAITNAEKVVVELKR
jgi:PBP1b-binding outer membrane lipoprotein LpoB